VVERPEDLVPADATLFSRTFWCGAAYARRGHWLHILSSVVLVAMLLVAVAAEGNRLDTAVRYTAWAGGGALGLAALLAGWERGRRWLLNGPVRVVAVGVVAVGLLGTAAVLAWRQPAPAPVDPHEAAPGIMPGILESFNILIVGVYAVALLHGFVALSGRFGARRGGRAQHRHPVAGRRKLPVVPGPFTVVAIGVWLLFAVWAGFLIWIARWLSPRAVAQGGLTADHLIYPLPYEVFAQLTALALVVIAVLVLVALGVRYAGLWLSSRWRRFPTLAPELRHWTRTSLPGGVRAAQPIRRRGRFPNAVRLRWRPNRWLGMVRDRKWFANVARWIERTLGLAALATAGGSIWYSVRFGDQWLGRNRLLWTVAGVALFCTGLTIFTAFGTLSRPVPPRASRTVPQWLGLFAGFAALVAASISGWYAIAPTVDLFGSRPSPQPLPEWLSGNPGITSTLLTAIPLGAVLLVRRSLRSPQTRRMVGIGWDVATFWPRAFHPLAPPSYAERSVPELETRLRYLLAGGAVLLGGHSQGAVVCTAAVAQLANLPAEQRRRLSVITYGNPTGHLYMRWFPHYVYPELVDSVRRIEADGTGAQAGVRWVNFFRHTDYIGRALFSADSRGPTDPAMSASRWAEDVWLPDPPTYWYRSGDGLPRVRGHAHDGYERQSGFATHAEGEVDRL
jgi:hypothetical protein